MVKLKIDVKGYIGDDWFYENEIYTVGYAFWEDEFLDKFKLNLKLKELNNLQEVTTFLTQLSGEFSIVINREDLKCFAVNHSRKYPLLFSQNENEILVQDYIEGEKFNPKQTSIFKQLHTTDGEATFFEGWRTLLYNQLAYIEGNELKIKRHKHYFGKTKTTVDLDKIDQTLTHAFERSLVLLAKRPVFLTLSGGYDSRLVLCKLLDIYPKEKISCYTYGSPHSEEAIIAKQITEKLGLKHIFIEYDADLFSSFFSQHFQEYMLKNHFGTQLPTEQNYYAVYALKKKNLLPKDAVFINGIFGDSVAGYALTDLKIKNAKKYIAQKHFISPTSDFPYENPIDNYENWHAQNRMFKFLSGANASFESFGYPVISPLGDEQWLALWTSLPKENRLNASLYTHYIFEKYFKRYGVDFKREVSNTSSLKSRVKKSLPQFLVKKIKQNKAKYQNKAAENNYDLLYEMLYEKLKDKPVKDYNFNKLYACYLLEILSEEKA